MSTKKTLASATIRQYTAWMDNHFKDWLTLPVDTITGSSTFITIAESLDVPHYSLKALLNHSMGNDVTGWYIQITTERLREPMQKIADRITELVTAAPLVEEQAEQVAIVR